MATEEIGSAILYLVLRAIIKLEAIDLERYEPNLIKALFPIKQNRFQTNELETIRRTSKS